MEGQQELFADHRLFPGLRPYRTKILTGVGAAVFVLSEAKDVWSAWRLEAAGYRPWAATGYWCMLVPGHSLSLAHAPMGLIWAPFFNVFMAGMVGVVLGIVPGRVSLDPFHPGARATIAYAPAWFSIPLGCFILMFFWSLVTETQQAVILNLDDNTISGVPGGGVLSLYGVTGFTAYNVTPGKDEWAVGLDAPDRGEAEVLEVSGSLHSTAQLTAQYMANTLQHFVASGGGGVSLRIYGATP